MRDFLKLTLVQPNGGNTVYVNPNNLNAITVGNSQCTIHLIGGAHFTVAEGWDDINRQFTGVMGEGRAVHKAA